MLVGFNGLALFGFLQRRTLQPLVNMTTFVRRPVLTTNIATLLIGSAMISTFVLVPQLGQLPKGGEIGFGLSATDAGLLLAPGGLASLLIAPSSGASARKADPRRRSSPAASWSPERSSGWRSPTARSVSSSSGAAS
jgi:hypothetical protein